MKKFIISLTFCVVLLALPFTVKAYRLDSHTALMTYKSGSYMAYEDYGCTQAIDHYICGGAANSNGKGPLVGDWLDIIADEGNKEITYPINSNITSGEDRGKAITTHWFKKDDIKSNADGGTGSFNWSWNQNAYYNHLPSSITYTDDHPENDPQIYVSNNENFYLSGGSINNSLMCGNGDTVMYASGVAYRCSADPSDEKDADWFWSRKSKDWSTDGLNQGYNTVYFAGTDASANYTTDSAQFLYDSVAPDISFRTDPSGYTNEDATFDFEADDWTSGVKYVRYKISHDYINWTDWYYGNSVTFTSDGNYVLYVEAWDNAGNSKTVKSNWICVDKHAPTITFNPSSPIVYTSKDDYCNTIKWSNTAQAVNAIASDSLSGMDSLNVDVNGVSYRNDGCNSSDSSYNVSTQLNNDDIYCLDADAYDKAGNEGESSEYYGVDTTAPSGEIYPYDYTGGKLNVEASADDGEGSGVSGVYAVLTDHYDSTKTKTVQLSYDDGSETWKLNDFDVPSLFQDSFQVDADFYTADNVHNTMKIGHYLLNIVSVSASISPSPAKQGQTITFKIDTVGYPTKLEIIFPTDISSLDSSVSGGRYMCINNQETLTTYYNYALPLKIQLTFDPDGNPLRGKYIFNIKAFKGTNYVTCSVDLDIQNNIYNGFRTQFIN